MKYSIIIFFSLALFHVEIVHSQVFERSRNESRTFKIFDETTLDINNKYGNIHLFTWDKDSVKVDVEVHVKANKESKVEKIFDYIDIEFSDTKFYINVETKLKQNQGSFWSEVSDLANTIFSGSNKAQINYDVFIPNGMEIKIENKFGNIYFADYKGKTTINLSNGDLKANNLQGYTIIDLGFGNASINSIDKGQLSVRYAEIELDNSNELEIESKSSTLNISKIAVLKLNSRRDKVFIDDLNTLTGNSYFSYLTIKNVPGNINMITEYGELKLEAVHKGFQFIELQSKYTDIYFDIPANVSCNLNVNHTEATEIYYPEHFENIQRLTLDKKEDKYKTSGVLGDKANAKGKIDIELIDGKLVIRDAVQIF